jgi:hypothetical protein
LSYYKSIPNYYEWLADKINEDTQRFKIYKRKSKHKLLVSWARKEIYKEILDEAFGDRCYLCGFKGRLELAHLYYEEDSVKGNANGARTLMRIIEAIKNPERFVRLCLVCHDIFDHSQRHGGIEYLRKCEKLLRIRDKKVKEASENGA